jgi:hypothetical protein
MVEALAAVLEYRIRLIAIWVIVMILTLVRLAAMQDVYTSGCVLTPLPLELAQGTGQADLGAASMRSILAASGGRDDFAVTAFLQSNRLMNEVAEEAEFKKRLFAERWDASASK